MSRGGIFFWGALGATVLLAACGSDSESSMGAMGAGGSGAAAGSSGFGGGFAGTSGTYAGSGGSGGSQPPPPPPEKEVESSYRSPVATGRYVWTANPDSGRVALVDATTLEVQTVEAGFLPTYVAALGDPDDPDSDAALVLNVGSHDATLLRASDLAHAVTLPTHEGANAVGTSPGGRWAVVWSDATSVTNADPTEGFQDVTVVDLTPGAEASTRLSVGYRPSRLFFSSDELRAFLVTEPGVSVIDLGGALGPAVTSLVVVTPDPIADAASRDVAITPDGTLAVVRVEGSPEVGFVSLADGTRTAVTLSGAVTDLDLATDGSRAVAVVREHAEVAVLPIPGVVDSPADFDLGTIEGETFGSVALAANAGVALLYTNALPNDHVTILRTERTSRYLTYRTVALKAPVRAVFPAADEQHAIALLDPGADSSKAGAFAVVPVGATLSPKIVGTDAPPFGVAIAAGQSAERALVTVRDDDQRKYGAYLVRLPSLQVDFVPLASPPLAAGIALGAGKGWIAQEHAEGRITFIDLGDGSARTLTGFELGAKVVD